MDGRRDDIAVLVCRVRERLCGWPLDSVDEVLREQPLRTLAAPVPHVPGFARIRGHWMPVVDVGSALDLGGSPLQRLVVVHHQGRPAALGVTDVIGVQRLDRAAVDALPALLQDERHAPIAGMTALNHELVALLDLGRLLPDLQLPDDTASPQPSQESAA
ncbi:CheW-like domain-containing protein [Roseateles sp. YR242]|uniref:chemotaxis protein CheW n=1 Tax=Roseateles sp. YR242 TaxID=1855305 RepID=UPI0008B087EC|nr:chemotaxis protein CheW [Roseateles sp. YR242]SEK94551.1 CheW-like domain-containing protein [Roseateles sp. YR242]